MSTKHEIKTIDDLVTLVTYDNRREFIDAITHLLDQTLILKAIGGKFDQSNPIKGVGFTWVEDGKQNFTTTVEATNEN